MRRALVAVVVLAGCSGSKGKASAIEDARSAPKAIDAAAPAPAATVHPYRVDTAAKTGDVQIRVEWKDVPQPLRAPGPATACGTPRVPALAPSTLRPAHPPGQVLLFAC